MHGIAKKRTFAAMMIRKLIILLVLWTCLVPVMAQDSLVVSGSEVKTEAREEKAAWPKVHPDFRVRPQQIVVPAAMIGIGAVAVANPKMCEWKMDFRDKWQDWRGTHRKANVETWATLSAQLAAVVIGSKTKHKFVDRILVKLTSYTLLYATMPVVNRCVREMRPDGHSNHSFPSFKSAAAFMVAEQTRIERGWAWGMGMYAFAAGVGALQMYNDRCYVNDIVAGAGMGILAVHAAYWLLPHERRWFGLDKRPRLNNAGMVLMPTFEPTTSTVGLAFAMGF